MRKWYKYFLVDGDDAAVTKTVDKTVADHVKGMRDYNPNSAYSSKDLFFGTYLPRNGGKHDSFDRFIRKHALLEGRILSIGSGRCANELWLSSLGYDITCSDLDVFPAHRETKQLFPNFKFIKLNILEDVVPTAFDAVISLSLIYLFDDSQLDVFFTNVAKALKKGGHLYLDSGGAPDHWLVNLLQACQALETRIFQFIQTVKKRKKISFISKHHGYRRTDDEFMRAAHRAGFTLAAQENYMFTVEFERVWFFNIIMRWALFKWVFDKLGRFIPYTRMYDLVKK